MQPNFVTCTSCRALLPAEIFNLPEMTPCPSCKEQLRVEIFPAFFHAPTVVKPEAVMVENESSCFYHPQKKAIVPCDSCGRFLCALCDLDLNGQHMCPTCLEGGKKKGKIKNLENKRVLYDRIALSLAVYPVILGFWLSIIGAPIALYVALRYRKEPCDITGGSKVRFSIAAVLAIVEIIGWIILITYLVRK